MTGEELSELTRSGRSSSTFDSVFAEDSIVLVVFAWIYADIAYAEGKHSMPSILREVMMKFEELEVELRMKFSSSSI